MRVRSTGLGKQQMKAEVNSIKLIPKNSILMQCETTEPVRWHIRIVLGHDDCIKIIGQMLKPSILFGVAKLILFKKGEAEPEGEW